eukprot:TRINITY_DN87584_c0_g1_i1.p1 TRINITY_DN87584_c0_g1~~TRINITY_DN87584_c0_g1_i1.p1  ORF type:complete len:419 (+),score=51.81 TRINITY_DN87584_c0_g1_i1:40-1257(+)
MDLSQLLKESVAELRRKCSELGLPSAGVKATLAQRLIENANSGRKRDAPEEQSGSLAEDIRAKLSCPVCFEVMLPPIRQCKEGHAVCGNCCDKLLQMERPKCPTCRCCISSSPARALHLEQVAAMVNLTCKWEGCMESVKYDNYAQHLGVCAKRLLNCPHGGAQCWFGPYCDLEAHITLCPKRPTQCPNGGSACWSGYHSDLVQHLRVCAKRPMICPMGGTACFSGTLSELRKHLRESHRINTKTLLLHDRPCGFKGCVTLNRSAGHRWRQRFWNKILRVRSTRAVTQGASFVAQLWQAGGSEPYLLQVQRIGRNKPRFKWTCTVHLKHGLEQLLWTCHVPDSDEDVDIWTRPVPKQAVCRGKVLVIPQSQMDALSGGPNTPMQLHFTLTRHRISHFERGVFPIG